LNDPKSDVKLINGIKKSFKSITAFNFPHPGRKVDRAKEATFDWRLPGWEHYSLYSIFVFILN